MGYETQPERQPFGRADSGRTAWRKWVALALLLALLALVLYSIYYFSVNRTLPIPGLGRSFEDEIEAPRYLYSISGPAGEEALTRPEAVEVSADDRVYVTDTRNMVIRVYTVEGNYLFSFNEIADGENTTIGTPVGLAISPDNELLVSDRRLRTILVFTLDGEYLRKIEPADEREAQVWAPIGMGYDEDGNLYVTDVGRRDLHQVVVFDQNEVDVRRFGTFGQAEEISDLPGQFYFPNDVFVIEDEIYVSDSDNRRIQVFSMDGRFERIIRTSGIPRGADVDGESRIIIADALAHQVDVYDRSGERLTGFGENGIGPGQFRYANDLSIDRRERIFVTDRLNHQVQVWGWPEPVPLVPEIPEEPSQWALCLSPLLLLPLLLLLRRRKFAVTIDFLEAMDEAGLIKEMSEKRRWVFIAPEEHASLYQGREIGGVRLEEFIRLVKHSESDVTDLVRRIGVERPEALMLVVGRQAERLCTEDPLLAVSARALGVDAYDARLFAERFMDTKESAQDA